jgi:hypothetical protein
MSITGRTTATLTRTKLVELSAEGPHKSVTMAPVHGLFALSISLFFSVPGAKQCRELQVGDKPQWHGVKHIQPSSTGFGSVSIGSGMSKADHGRG